ncbi:SMEK domain-containing protein [Morganella morganii]|uniref:SMEK domain-containing protein n=1 Tax=Morganella morganii TaxID=582 RepID=UPI000B02D79E|nr:SMEK domain-containing protein [Morganella morganii]
MPTDRERLIKQCAAKVATFSSYLHMLSRLNLNDAAIIAESNMLDIVNFVFDMEFTDLNKKNNNSPGIDYLDEKRDTGMQVTRDASYTKIKHSINIISNSRPNLNAVWFLFLINRPYQPRMSSYNGIRIESITLSDILIKINTFPNRRLIHVHSLLKELSIDSYQYVGEIIKTPIIPENINKFHAITEKLLQKRYLSINPNFSYEINYEDLFNSLNSFIMRLQKISQPMREFIAEIIILSDQNTSTSHAKKITVQIENLFFSLSEYHQGNIEHYINYLKQINILYTEDEILGVDESKSNEIDTYLKYNRFITVSYPDYNLDIDMFIALKHYFNALGYEQKIRDAIIYLDFTLLGK